MTTIPSLKALRAFDEAAASGSFSLAAERLYVTQGAVSRLIRQLEEDLGTSLFERHGSGVRLTAAGQRLQESTRSAFRLLRDGCAELRHWQQPRPLLLACPGSFMMRWLIPRLDQLRLELPGLELQLQALETAQRPAFEQELESVDVAILNAPLPTVEGWVCHTLAPDEFGPVCAPALARELRTPADLARFTLLHVGSRPEVWQQWSELAQQSLHVASGTGFDHLSYMLEAALAGLGVAIAPGFLVARDLAEGRLCAPFGFVRGPQDYLLLQRVNTNAEVQALVVWLLKATADAITAGVRETPGKSA